MLLLAADTSGKHGGIALARCGPGDACEVLEVVALEGGTFSAQLIPQVAALLQKHGLNKQDLGAFAVASGPGSFTGLRVGLAAIKGLAEILDKPIVAVSLLEAVVSSSQNNTPVLALMDAGRNEVFARESGPSSGAPQERLLSRNEVLSADRTTALVTPDQPLAEWLRTSGREVEEVARPSSADIAFLGWKKLQAGQSISPQDLDANYIRRSDAEIFSVKNS